MTIPYCATNCYPMSDASLFPFREPADNPGYLLWQVTMRWQREMKEGLDPLGLTQTQFSCLAALAYLREVQFVVYQTEVAAHVGIDRMLASKVIQRLEKMGFIERLPHPDDSRAKELRMTEVGTEKLRAALRIVGSIDEAFFGVLGREEAAFREGMRRLF